MDIQRARSASTCAHVNYRTSKITSMISKTSIPCTSLTSISIITLDGDYRVDLFTAQRLLIRIFFHFPTDLDEKRPSVNQAVYPHIKPATVTY